MSIGWKIAFKLLKSESQLRKLLIDVNAVLVVYGDPAERVVALAGHALEVRQRDHLVFYDLCYVVLHILCGGSGIDCDDLYLRKRHVRNELQRKAEQTVDSEGDKGNEDHGDDNRMLYSIMGDFHLTLTFCPSRTFPCPSTIKRVFSHFWSMTSLVLSAAMMSNFTYFAVWVSGS